MPASAVANSAARRRERRVVIGGASVVVVGLLLAYVLVPFARTWSARERDLRGLLAEADSLAGLVASAAQLESAASAKERVLAASQYRVLHARSATLAASSLQALLQDASDAAHLVVTRLDVAQTIAQNGASVETADAATAAAAVQSGGPSVTLPATLSAYCDIVGLASLLDHLARAPRVVYVERMTVQQNSSLRGAPDMLQVTLTLRAPVVLE